MYALIWSSVTLSSRIVGIFAKIFSRRGLHLNAYKACQSIIRGGHTFLAIRSTVSTPHDQLPIWYPRIYAS